MITSETLMIFLSATFVGIAAGIGMGLGIKLFELITKKNEKEMDITQ
jgi:hypothetical protein